MHPFESQVLECWPADSWRDLNVLLAVSGGADSVAMLRAVANIKHAVSGKGTLTVAHFNHQLRDRAADDARWVEQLGEQFATPVLVGQGQVAEVAELDRNGIENAARQQRYFFLEQTAAQLGARYLATAHTHNDQAETVLHRILRGTGIAGLSGIPAYRKINSAISLVRPMLSVSRQQVIGYLQDLDQSYRTDESNTNLAFTRNRIRHELIPHLKDSYNPQVSQSLVQLAAQATDLREVVEQLAEEIWHEAGELNASATELILHCEKVPSNQLGLIAEVIRCGWRQAGWAEQGMTYRHWREMAEMAQAESLPQNSIGGVQRPEKLEQSNGFETCSKSLPSCSMMPGKVKVERAGSLLSLQRFTI